MIIKIKVKPNSSESKVEKSESGEVIVRVKEKAEDNKANIAVIKALSKYYNGAKISYSNASSKSVKN